MEPKVFDLEAAAEYLRTIGFSSATVNTVRKLIAERHVRSKQIGRRFYVSKDSLDHLITGLNGPESRGRYGAA